MTTSVLSKPGQVGNADELLGVAARHARGGDVLQSGGATRRNHAPLRSGQFGQPPSDRIRQFVQLYIVLAGGFHRGADFRQFDRCADDRESAAAIDDRFDADRLIDLRACL